MGLLLDLLICLVDRRLHVYICAIFLTLPTYLHMQRASLLPRLISTMILLSIDYCFLVVLLCYARKVCTCIAYIHMPVIFSFLIASWSWLFFALLHFAWTRIDRTRSFHQAMGSSYSNLFYAISWSIVIATHTR